MVSFHCGAQSKGGGGHSTTNDRYFTAACERCFRGDSWQECGLSLEEGRMSCKRVNQK